MWGTDNGEQLVYGQTHRLVAVDGREFTGECMGLGVERGVAFATFRHVVGDLPTKGGTQRFGKVALSDLSTPRPRAFWDA